MRSRAARQTRRTKILQAACKFIASEVQGGVRVGRAIKVASRKFRQRSRGDGRRIRLSEKTMRRLWYAWRALRDDSVFFLRYQPGCRPAAIAPSFLRLVAETSIGSGRPIAAVLRSSKSRSSSRVSTRTIYRRLPVGRIRRLARLQRAVMRQQLRVKQERSELIASLPR